jgi:NitT/TauT family transport system permease protein
LQKPKIPTWIFPIIVFVLIWEIAARAEFFPGYLFPSFSQVIATTYTLTVSGVLTKNVIFSLARVLTGFIAGAVAGISVGILMGLNEASNKALNPIFSLLMPIPALGWLPLFMLWIGISDLLPISLIFMCSFFPVLYNTMRGVKSVDRDYINVARTLGASRYTVLRTVILPLALPNIFTGLRLEAGMAWRVTVPAEMIAIPTGIGALLTRSEALLQVDVIMTCLITLSFMCLLFERFFIHLERRFNTWAK